MTTLVFLKKVAHWLSEWVTCIQNVHLIGFVAERMKRLEGPPFSRTIAPFFLFGILPPPDYSCLELVLELVSGTSPRISPPPKLSSRGTRWGEAPHHPLLPPPPSSSSLVPITLFSPLRPSSDAERKSQRLSHSIASWWSKESTPGTKWMLVLNWKDEKI